jgi:oligosaccharide translocation protein RFT1
VSLSLILADFSEPYDQEIFGLAMANTRQSVIKHILTEGDRIVVGRISPLGDQGGYAVAINYGPSHLLC